MTLDLRDIAFLPRAAAAAGITFVGVAQTDPTSSNISSLSLNVPSGVQNGDLLIAVVFATGGNAGDWVQTSWTWASEQNSANPNLGVAYRTASSEPASYAFTITNSRRMGGFIMAFRGATWDTVGTLAASTTATGITVAANNSILFATWGINNSSVTFTAPTNMTEVARYSGSNGCNFAAYRQNVNAGASGSRTVTTSSTTGIGGILFAIKPT